jgi:hypothetical protein
MHGSGTDFPVGIPMRPLSAVTILLTAETKKMNHKERRERKKNAPPL